MNPGFIDAARRLAGKAAAKTLKKKMPPATGDIPRIRRAIDIRKSKEQVRDRVMEKLDEETRKNIQDFLNEANRKERLRHVRKLV